MKINIKQDSNITETEITISCKQIDKELEAVISSLGLINHSVSGKLDGETFFIALGEVLYFETIDNKTFFYTNDKIYETSIRIYQLEEKLTDTPFVRINKSSLMNIQKVKSIKSEENSKLMATLSNGEKIVVSRQYMQNIKTKLGV